MYQVTAAGYQTAGKWQATVHSIFANAVNLLVNDKRFTLLFNPLWISENNIIVSDSAILAFIDKQSILSSDKNYLYINGIAQAQYGEINRWQMPQIACRPISQPALSKLSMFLDENKSNAMWHSIEINFINATNNFCHNKSADFSRLIGAGPGLTPSGDDMLVGFALAIWYHSPFLLPKLSAACTPLLHLTTDISKYLLADALDGKFTFPLVNLLIALTQEKAIDDAISLAANVGSSSGRDSLFGFYHGLKSLNMINST